MRRVASRAFAITGAATAQRFFKPPEDLKKLYESDFEKEQYPASFAPSEASVFARFLYKAAEQKNAFDAISKDFETISAAEKKLPVFWERTVDVDQAAEFKSLNPATLFTMAWMQKNGMLGDLSDVRSTYEAFVNAKKNRVVATIYIPGPEKDHAAAVKDAKEVAKKIQSDSPYAKQTLEFKIVQDSEFASGYAVECADKYYSTAKGKFEDSGDSDKSKDVDYTNLPTAAVTKTAWNQNIETEVLSKYLDGLAKFDQEEAVNGV